MRQLVMDLLRTCYGETGLMDFVHLHVLSAQTIEDRFNERHLKNHLERLKAIRERENQIPGPCEAKHIMRIIEQEHLRTCERRLKVSTV